MDIGKHSGDLPQILAALLEQNKRAALRRANNKGAKSGVKPRWRPAPGPAVRKSQNTVAAIDTDDNATDSGSAPFSESTSGTVGSPTVAGVQRSRILPNELTLRQKQSIYECLNVYTHGVPEKDLTPHQWFFVEAVEYWNAVILRNREEDEFAVYERPTKSHGYYPTFKSAPTAVTAALAYHISAVYRERGLPIEWDGTSEMSAIWTKFHAHLGGLIRLINEQISLSATEKVPGLLDRIMMLTVLIDTYISPRTWRPHVDAFLRLLYLRGGIEGATASGEVSNQGINLMVVRAVMAETTSPATEPVRGLDLFSLDDLRQQYLIRFASDCPCPTVLFIQIRVISQLRARVSEGARREQVAAAAQEILAAIAPFSPAHWTDSEPSHWNFSDNPKLFESMAHMYKDGALLYGILSLPEYAASILRNGASKSEIRQRLLRTIGQTWALINAHHPPLFWCLVVAGVAFADGDKASQKIISDRIHQIGRRPDCSAAPLYILRKLEIFWDSGSTSWEDCFDECLMGTAA